MQYVYDESGSPIGINYRTNAYAANVFDVFYFEKNLQGDIVAIYNDSGTRIGTYTYDAWGNFIISTTSGITSLENSIVRTYNPFRYRGYYYDKDIGMYYLQSRYYNPQWGRFVNADGYISTGTGFLGYNMFTYCNNNPVMNVDPMGDCPWLFFAIGFGVGLYIGVYIAPSSTTINTDADEHYKRNEMNKVDLEIEEIINTYEKQPEGMDQYHEYTTGKQGEEAQYNNKYLSPDGGHFEVIICEVPGKSPYIVDETVDALNMGTYNYASNDNNPMVYGLTHFFKDMLPYYLYGNTREDGKGVLKWALN